jgi:D-alanyl-D-alanine carboxypeptidase (penicillin-binding protein 5/6)
MRARGIGLLSRLSRGRTIRVVSAWALLVVIVGALATSGANNPLSWWLRGWPWGPGDRSALPGDQDQAVLAYQARGPDAVMAEADPAEVTPGRALAGGGGEGLQAAVGASGGSESIVTVVGPLSGDLAPKSAAAILVEQHSGKVLYAKNEHERRPIASVTKVMTLAIIFDALEGGRAKLTDQVTASARAAGHGGSQIWLEVGESMSLHEMLIAIAVGSANDACVAVAEHLYGTVERFVAAMNEKARELGMVNTNFVNPHGLDAPDHYSSAYDVALLSRYAAAREGLLGYTARWIEHLRDGKTLQSNHNRLVRHYPGCDGLKTGWTAKTGHCLAATAMREGSRFISVVLGAPTSEARFAEAAGLLNAAFGSFRSVPLAKRGEAVAEVAVERGTAASVSLVVKDDFGAVVPKGANPDVQKRVVASTERFFAPIQAGQVLGELVVEADGVEVGRTQLFASHAVARANVWQLMWKAFSVLISNR